MAIPPGSNKIDFVSEKIACSLDGNRYTVKMCIEYNQDVCLVTPDCGFYKDSSPICVNCFSSLMKKYKALYQSELSNLF